MPKSSEIKRYDHTFTTGGQLAKFRAYMPPEPMEGVIGFEKGFASRSEDYEGLCKSLAKGLNKPVFIVESSSSRSSNSAKVHQEKVDTLRDGILFARSKLGRSARDASFSLVGHSWGAAAAISTADNYPDTNIKDILTIAPAGIVPPINIDSLVDPFLSVTIAHNIMDQSMYFFEDPKLELDRIGHALIFFVSHPRQAAAQRTAASEHMVNNELTSYRSKGGKAGLLYFMGDVVFPPHKLHQHENDFDKSLLIPGTHQSPLNQPDTISAAAILLMTKLNAPSELSLASAA